MKRAGKLLLVLALMLITGVGAGHAADYVYVTTNMTWAEFYAGELGAVKASDLAVSYDAVSTATQRFINRFEGFTSEVSGDGTVFDGVKNVQVRMTGDVYGALSDKSRFSNPINGTFDEYKEMDDSGAFGAMSTETVDANAKLPDLKLSIGGGKSQGHGNYRITISGLNYASLDVDLGTSNDRFLGAKLETTDGTVYGLKPLHNLWIRGNMAEQIGFCVEDFAERNGTHLSYAHTASLPGKTISKVTYMLKNQPDIVVTCNLPVKLWTSATIAPTGSVKSGTNVAVPLTFNSIPEGAAYSLASVAKVEGRTSTPLTAGTDYTYSDNTLTFTNAEAGSYTATFTSESYVDVVASITVTDYYATTNMTWAEFYAGEIGASSSALAVSYDAVSTATTRFASRFEGFTSTSSDSGTTFTGVKGVQVRMTGNVYDSLSDKSRYTFSNDSFNEYKVADASGDFGAMSTETIDANEKLSDLKLSITGGKSQGHGNYRITISGLNYASLDVDLGTSNDRFLGAKLETTDGTVYGLKPLHNLWIRGDMAEQIGFSVEDFVERNGTHLSYAHTASLPGKTISKVTYMLKNQPDIVISCDLPVKLWSDATISPEGTVKSGSNVAVPLTFSNIPDGAGYTLSSVAKVVGRTSTPLTAGTDYTYSGNTLTFTKLDAGSYTATFTSASYVDVVASINAYAFATTDMTWAEFYAGELGKTSADLLAEGLDAVSSPTARIAGRMSQLTSESNDIGGRDITGVKAVQVRFDGTAYEALSNDTRFTFVDEALAQYKPVNSDGSFGAVVSETQTMASADVTLSSGASATWGSYVLNITGLEGLVLTSGDENYYLGAVLETSDGAKYGLRHNTNLWFNAGTVAVTVNDKYVEPHGVTRDYAYTKGLEGATITKITFIVKNQPSAAVNCSVYLKKMTDSTVSTVSTNIKTGVNVPISFTFGNLPEGVAYTLKALYSGTGRGRTLITDYTYANNTLTVNGTLPAGTYQAVFGTDDYADIAVIFTVEDVYHYASTNMTWAEFYAGETGGTSADLYAAGLDAISSPTARVANRFTQLTSESNDKGGRDITGVKAIHVRMGEAVYNAVSNDSRYTFSDEAFSEYKDVNADGSFGKMLTETHVQEGATVALTSPGTWGDYQLAVSSIDITVSSGDDYYYLGALVETSDGKVYGMRHNNNLWFNAKDLAISTAEFVEPHGVSRSYAYTSDMEGKTITKITYMLKDLPDEVVSCDVFLKLKTSASVAPKYTEGWHAFLTTGEALSVDLVFSNVPSSADYSLSGITFGTGRNRQNVTAYTYSNGVLTFTEAPSPGTYTATFTDKTYANIAATINIFTVNATDKVISADKNAAGISFMLTPSGVIDSVDKDMADNKFVPASEYTDISANVTANYTAGYHEIAGSGFSFDITLKDVPSGFMGISGFGKMAHLTPENCDELYPSIYSAVDAMPTGPSGYKEVSSMTSLKPLGIRAIAVQPDGSARDVSEFTGAGVMVLSSSDIMVYYGTMMADCVSSDITEGEHMLSPEGENIIADGKADGHVSGVMYLEIMQSAIELLDEASNPAGIQFDTLPAGFIEQADRNAEAKGITWVDERNVVSGASSAFVTGKANQVPGNSGYTFTIPYDRSSIPSGHTAALGFERSFFFTRSNLGESGYNSLVSAMSSMTKIPGYDWVMPTASELHALGLAVVAEYPDGTSRDVTGESSIGLLASGESVMMQYGAIALDRALTSNEGELLDMVMESTPLISDGLADGKITVTWYITRTTGGGNGDESPDVPVKPRNIHSSYDSAEQCVSNLRKRCKGLRNQGGSRKTQR